MSKMPSVESKGSNGLGDGCGGKTGSLFVVGETSWGVFDVTSEVPVDDPWDRVGDVLRVAF